MAKVLAIIVGILPLLPWEPSFPVAEFSRDQAVLLLSCNRFGIMGHDLTVSLGFGLGWAFICVALES